MFDLNNTICDKAKSLDIELNSCNSLSYQFCAWLSQEGQISVQEYQII